MEFGNRDGLDADPKVAATVHLLHRRRGWVWTLTASTVALVLYTILAVRFLSNTTGLVNDLAGVAVILLFALVVLSLVVVIVDTVRLHRREPAVQAQARGPFSGRPVITPVQHRPRHVLFWFILVSLILPAPASLPYQVNGYAYAVGAGATVSFLPQSHEVQCGRAGCSTVTDGILVTHPPIGAVWRYNVPLGRPFPVRQPVWDGLGLVDLMNATQATEAIVLGLFFDVLAVLIVLLIIHRTLSHRRSARKAVPGAVTVMEP